MLLTKPKTDKIVEQFWTGRAILFFESYHQKFDMKDLRNSLSPYPQPPENDGLGVLSPDSDEMTA